MQLTSNDFSRVFDAWADIMQRNKERLIQLDSVMGDGDLGLSMTDGFEALRKFAHETDITDFGTLFYYIGKTMNANASSSLGTLISFGFMEAGKAFKGKETISGCDISVFLEKFQDGIIIKGKAKIGEKTFLDGFDPAVRIMKKVNNEDKVREGLRDASIAAKSGAENTMGMLACWGRAARRGEDSRKFLDPGAVAAALMVEALANCFEMNA